MSIQTRINAIQEKAKTLGVIVELNLIKDLGRSIDQVFFFKEKTKE